MIQRGENVQNFAELLMKTASSLKIAESSGQTSKACKNSDTNDPGKGFVNIGSQGTLGTIINHENSGVSSILNRKTTGVDVGGMRDRGLFYGQQGTKALTFHEKLVSKADKSVRFSALCCALLLGISPLVALGAMTSSNGTMINNGLYTQPISNGGSITSVINQTSGTITGDITNDTASGRTLNLSNGGTIRSSTITNFGGFLNINNQTGGIMDLRWFITNASSQGMSLTNSGTLRSNDYAFLRAFTGTVYVTNQTSGYIVKAIRSQSNNFSGVPNMGDANLNITNSGTIASNVRHESSGRATINNTGSITSIVNKGRSASGTISNSGTIDTVFNEDTATLSINSSGTITSVINWGRGFNLSSTAGTIANITNVGTAATITSSGTSNIGSIINTTSTTSSVNQRVNSNGNLNVNSTGGSIANITNSGGTTTIANSGTGNIGSVNNQSGTVILNNASANITSISNANGATLNLSNNQGTIAGNVSNAGIIAGFSNSGTIIGSLDNQAGGLIGVNIDSTDSASILGGINNIGTITGLISNSSSRGLNVSNRGILRDVSNTNGTLNLTNTAGSVASINNASTGTLNVNSSGGNISTISNNGSLSLTNTAGSVATISNTNTGTLNVNSSGGNIGIISNSGTRATITNSGSSNIGTLDNQRGTATLSNSTGASITSVSNANTATLNLDTNQGTINSIVNKGIVGTLSNSGSIAILDNRGTINNNLSNTGTLASLTNNGTLLGTLDNRAGGTIGGISNTGLGSINGGINNAGTITGTISHSSDKDLRITNTGSIANINNAGTATLNNNANGVVTFILNVDDATLSLGNNEGIMGLMTNQGTIIGDVSNNGTIRILYNEFDGEISGSIKNTDSIGEIDNEGIIAGDVSNSGTIGTLHNEFLGAVGGNIDNTNSGFIGEINNEGLITGTITNSSSSSLNITNSGTITGGVKALGSSSINVTSEEDSILGAVYNGGSGQITLSGLTAIARNTNTGSGYDITNNGGGNINVKNLFVDLQPYVDSYRSNKNFSKAYTSRVSLGGSGLSAIGIDHVTVRLTDIDLLDTFLIGAVNVSQFINGALGDTNRNAHDCSSTGNSGCVSQTDPDGDVRKAYIGGELIDGLKDNVGDQNFISVQGAHSFALTLADKHGNFNVVAKPENSGAANLDKLFLSSIKARASFIDNVVSSSIEDLKHYFDRFANDYERFEIKALSYDRNELYASLTSDLIPRDTLREKSLYLKDSAIYILPYFSSQSTHLDDGDTAKGHSSGLIAGYTSFTDDNLFYSVYGGYQDTRMRSNSYSTSFKTFYTGFKVSDYLKSLGDNAELVVQYDGRIARTENSIRDNEETDIHANPRSYSLSLGVDLGVNYFMEKDTFAPQVGLGYEGGFINAYKLDVPFDKTKFNTYNTRAKVTWIRDWTPHLQTMVSAGVKYYFNPDVEFHYELAGDKINGVTKLARWGELVGVDFIVPLNEAFYFKLSYNGTFSKGGNGHTGFAKFNYSF